MLPTKPKIKRTKSGDEALASLMRLCARAERSSGDALRLMKLWGVGPAEQQRVLKRLLDERFIDDRRYAEAFVREKTSLTAWGEFKIRAALQRKGIASPIIAEALAAAPQEGSTERLTNKLRSKLRTTKYDTLYQLKGKLLRYAASLGHPIEEAMEAVEQVMSELTDK